jgi:hypothetical protein
MKQFYQKFKNIFGSKTTTPVLSDSAIRKTNKIIFEILDDGNIEINLEFKLPSNNASANLGKFLYDLNSGQVSETIMDLMVELGHDYPEYADLVKNAILVWLTEWSKIQNENESININEDEPLVSPTQFSPKT